MLVAAAGHLRRVTGPSDLIGRLSDSQMVVVRPNRPTCRRGRRCSPDCRRALRSDRSGRGCSAAAGPASWCGSGASARARSLDRSCSACLTALLDRWPASRPLACLPGRRRSTWMLVDAPAEVEQGPERSSPRAGDRDVVPAAGIGPDRSRRLGSRRLAAVDRLPEAAG